MNLDEFPKMDNGYLVVPKPSHSISGHQELYERFCCAIYMAANINGKAGLHMISNEGAAKAYLRAALAEFFSIEDILRVQFASDTESYMVKNSSNPLFHLMKLLRNYNVHLAATSLEKKEVVVALPTEPGRSYAVSVAMIDNLEVEELKKVRDSKYYSDSDLKKMINNFNREQKKFGVGDLIIKGLIMYSAYVGQFLTKQSIGLR